MGGHFFILAIIHIIFGALGLLGTAALGLVAVLGTTAVAAEEGAAGGILAGGLFSVLVGVAFLFWVLPELLCGWWMLQRKPIGRILGIILGILYLPGFPLGTALGVWSLWALLSEEGARDYARGLPR